MSEYATRVISTINTCRITQRMLSSLWIYVVIPNVYYVETIVWFDGASNGFQRCINAFSKITCLFITIDFVTDLKSKLIFWVYQVSFPNHCGMFSDFILLFILLLFSPLLSTNAPICIQASSSTLLYCRGHPPSDAWFPFSLLYCLGHPPSCAWLSSHNRLPFFPSILSRASPCWCLATFRFSLLYCLGRLHSGAWFSLYPHRSFFPSVSSRAAPLVPGLLTIPAFPFVLLSCLGSPPDAWYSLYTRHY